MSEEQPYGRSESESKKSSPVCSALLLSCSGISLSEAQAQGLGRQLHPCVRPLMATRESSGPVVVGEVPARRWHPSIP